MIAIEKNQIRDEPPLVFASFFVDVTIKYLNLLLWVDRERVSDFYQLNSTVILFSLQFTFQGD